MNRLEEYKQNLKDFGIKDETIEKMVQMVIDLAQFNKTTTDEILKVNYPKISSLKNIGIL